MSVFKQREKSMEAKFARDGELQFHARIQALRFLATWAAAMKGAAPAGERELVQTLVRENMRHPGDERIIAVTLDYLGDLAGESIIRSKLDEFGRDATAVTLMAKAS
jgi:hypothetical protein